MEEKKKKKLTLSGSVKKSISSINYEQSRGKTSVVIEKREPKWD